jgi:hypothetical protein
LRRITISTSWSSAVKRFIRRSTEKPANLSQQKGGCAFRHRDDIIDHRNGKTGWENQGIPLAQRLQRDT